MAKHTIILDCDPGVDDALALMLALASPEAIEIAGITTVAGNVSLDDVTRNARGLLALAGRSDIPLHAGCARPLMRAVGHRAVVHGEHGLGGVLLPHDAVDVAPGHAVDFIIDTVMANPGRITLCPIGPMTNVALAMVKEPRLAENLREIVFMGGSAFGPGNTTASAEFNFYVDPHAAQIMLSSGARMTMFGLDVTSKVAADPALLAQLESIPGDRAKALVRMMIAYAKGDPCLHDPCVIAWLIDPSLFSGIDALVDVECVPGSNYGRSVAHVTEKHRGGKAPNCLVIDGAETARIFDLFDARLRLLD